MQPIRGRDDSQPEADASAQPKPAREFQSNIPSLELPVSGGALRSIGEKFSVNPATGTGNLSIPVGMVPMRGAPELALSYDSGAGNGSFGLGWSLGNAQISRKTEKRLPTYDDHEDVFVLAGFEDLIATESTFDGDVEITTYSPRTEGAFSWIRRFREGEKSWWEVVSRDNVRRWFGKYADDLNPSHTLQISDPEQPGRNFAWLLAEERDDRGNRTRYEYKAEDDSGCDPLDPTENNRGASQSHRYLKRILYSATPAGSSEEWAGEIVLDYGEHDNINPSAETALWGKRSDPFSTYRSGFDVRQRRLCRRILQFNLMPETDLEGRVLNFSTELEYDHSAIATKVKSIRHVRYEWDGAKFNSEAFPSASFEYATSSPQDLVHSLSGEAAKGTPTGLSGGHRFIDLNGTGISGILSEQANTWYFRENLGGGCFELPQTIERPFGFAQLNGTGQITTLDNDGQPFLASYGALAGYAERIPEADCWADYRPFPKLPNIAFDDPKVRWLDLNGDGRPEVCLLNDEVLSWWENQGTDGIGNRTDCPLESDEQNGPAQIFLSNLESIYTADLSGDGLSDIVRIRNGEVSYWPNLGYGRFGPKVEMNNPPRFAPVGEYDPARLQLGDVDGSGTTDLLYLDDGAARFWLNEAGNSWSSEHRLTSLPHFHQMTDVSLVDLLGNGTSALVWSSNTPSDVDNPWRYINLMVEEDWTQVDVSSATQSHSALESASFSSDMRADLSGLDVETLQELRDIGVDPSRPSKPYLLREVDNGMGAITRLSYAPSTEFYLSDKARGEPWRTRLPFPVHVVTRQEVIDEVSGDRYVRRSSYHHGYYDRAERQFHGFGRVDSWDLECAKTSDVTLFERTPIMTRQWFHTGAHLAELGTSRLFADEYHPTDHSLPDSVIDGADVLSAAEVREANRALRGQPLRSEVYACKALIEGESKPQIDGHPYSVTENRFRIRVAGPDDQDGKKRIFQSVPEESLSQHFEQQADDPRIAHQMTLRVDDYGAPELSASIAYGRIEPDPSSPVLPNEQTATRIVLEESNRIDRPFETDVHRIGIPVSACAWEMGSDHSLANGLLRPADLLANTGPGSPIETEKLTELSNGQRRLLSASFQLYRANADLGLNAQPLDFGNVDTLALPSRSYALVFSPNDVADADGNFTDSDFTEGKYEDPAELAALPALQGFLDLLPETTSIGGQRKSGWWARDYEAELSPALFYSPIRARNPWSAESSIEMDDLALAVTSTTAHLQHTDLTTTAEIDYRLMQPWRVTEPNGTVQTVRFDLLGRPIQTAVTGPEGEGDALDGLTQWDTSSTASSWMAYEFFKGPGQPAWTHSWTRETHASDLNGGGTSRWMEARTYSDGFGREVLSKAKAAPGEYDFEASGIPSDGTITDPRWVGSGRTIFDNKGNPVLQYEPYFTNSVEYGDGAVQHGVSPTIHYDPLDRAVRTELPDGTETRVEFTPWEQHSFDAFDTFDPVKAPSYDAIAAEHQNTPTVEHLDSLGRPFRTEVTNFNPNTGVTETYISRVDMDIVGNVLRVIDAKGQVALEERFDRAGRPIRSESNDAGTSYALTAMDGQPRIGILANGHRIEQLYDTMRRPTELWVTEPDGTRYLREATIYADDPAFPGTKGKGRVWRVLDPCGLVETQEYDFKGLPVETSRHVLGSLMQANSPPPDYTDWSTYDLTSDLSALWGESFTTTAQVDAMGRPVVATAPDGSEQHFTYDGGGAMFQTTLKNAPGIPSQPIVTGVEYDSKGRRSVISYGNGTKTTYSYDPLTFRLTRLTTTRSSGEVLQDMTYSYDPLGNIVEIKDEAQDAIISGNQTLHPVRSYQYDSIARLVRATGREHIAQVHADQRNAPSGLEMPAVNDTAGVKAYTETWLYDAIGNIAEWKHSGSTSAQNWKRLYHYDQPGRNELSRTEIAATGSITNYHHDSAGNIRKFGGYLSGTDWNSDHGHLTDSNWNVDDQPERMVLNGNVTAAYRYDAAGERLLKRVEKGGVTEIRLYLGGYEVFRKFSGGSTLTKRQDSLHVMDGESRILMIETEKLNDDTQQAGVIAQRWQLSDHLGTCAIELDETGNLLSYEEMHAYGTTAWHWRASGVSHKRYRYTGMERDEESGLQYHSARYYLPWLGRWLSCDDFWAPGDSPFSYVECHPVGKIDKEGQWGKPWFSKLWSGVKSAVNAVKGGISKAYNWAKEHKGEIASFVLDSVPPIAQIKAGIELVTGKDLITGESKSRLGTLLSFVPMGGVIKKAVSVTKKLLKPAMNFVNKQKDKLIAATKRLLGVTNKSKKASSAIAETSEELVEKADELSTSGNPSTHKMPPKKKAANDNEATVSSKTKSADSPKTEAANPNSQKATKPTTDDDPLKVSADGKSFIDPNRGTRRLVTNLIGSIWEKYVADQMHKYGIVKIATQVGVKTDAGRRVVDIVGIDEAGEMIFFEIKSGKAFRNKLQMWKDELIETEGGKFYNSSIRKLSDSGIEAARDLAPTKTIEFNVNEFGDISSKVFYHFSSM